MEKERSVQDRDERLDRTRCSLEGLSVGDAFGERFFYEPNQAKTAQRIAMQQLPLSPWRYTDDTQMALSLVSI